MSCVRPKGIRAWRQARLLLLNLAGPPLTAFIGLIAPISSAGSTATSQVTAGAQNAAPAAMNAATTNRHISTILLEPVEDVKILHDSPRAGKQ